MDEKKEFGSKIISKPNEIFGENIFNTSPKATEINGNSESEINQDAEKKQTTNLWNKTENLSNINNQKNTETLVKNAFSADFVKNFDSQKEFARQHEVYARNEEPSHNISAKISSTQTKITEKTSEKETTISSTKTVIETPNFDMIKVKESGLKFDEKKKIKKRFRLKLIALVYCVVFALCGGWVVYNSIEINNTNYQIVQYLVKIDQLDTGTNAQTGDGNLINVAVEIEPNKLAEPTETQPQTNWFDKFCNWFSRIFK